MMNTEWAAFLQSQQAHIDEHGVSHFGEQPAAATRAENCLCDLSQFGLLRISGDDATTFLQGQLSNDVNALDGTHHQLSSYCTPKGRMLASLRLFRDGDDYFALLPADTLEATVKRLRMFVLMSKVVIDDLGDSLIRVGVAGPGATASMQACNLPTPAAGELAKAENFRVLGLPGSEPRFILIGEPADIQAAWQGLATSLPPAGYHSWALYDIDAGLPSVYSDTVEAFVPQMLNLHAIDGVSFSKGCYPGQEIVARMHFLGKLKRRMYHAHVDTDTAPAPGDALFSADSDSGQGAGNIVMSAALSEGGYDVLAVVQISSQEQGELHLGEADGPLLEFIGLPYEVPLEREK